MRKILGLVVLSAVSLVAQGHQGRGLGLEDQYADGGSSVGSVGADGTVYVLQHDSTASTSTATVTDLIAIGPAATPATTFKVQLTGQIGSVIGGASTVYVEQTTVTGTGSTATRSTAILWLSSMTGTQIRATAITGSVDLIAIKTVGTRELLYVTSTQTSTTTNGGTTTTTTTHNVTIYAPDGTVVKSVNL